MHKAILSELERARIREYIETGKPSTATHIIKSRARKHYARYLDDLHLVCLILDKKTFAGVLEGAR